MAQPTHYLIGLEESSIAIGRFGFQSGTRGQTIVDIGRAKNIEDAKAKAVTKYAKVNGVNPILVKVVEARVLEASNIPRVDAKYSVDLTNLASTIGAGNVATMGNLTIKVRKSN